MDFQVKEDFKTPKATIKTDSKKERLAALAALTKGIQSGATRIEEALPPLLNEALDSPTWSWPRETIRQNGTVVGDTRTITDTGALKASGNVTVKFLKTKTNFFVTYKAPYARLVHEGGYILPYGDATKTPTYVPGRPWIAAVLDGDKPGINYLDIGQYMEESITSDWG